VLLLIIIGLVIWAFLSGTATKGELPPLQLQNGIVLILIGLVAGMLGGIIGNGGCSVMLPVIRSWSRMETRLWVSWTLMLR
jgi:hypothetical protein